jgi:UDP-glucuronate 4-epimerase
MALYIFTKAIVEGKEFDIFNNGDMSRDYTYVDDIVESIKRLIPLSPKHNNPKFNINKSTPSKSTAPYQIFNIGNNSPVALMDFVEAIEKALGKKGKRVFKPIHPGDVTSTYANVQRLFDYIDFKPETNIETVINNFVEYYLKYVEKAQQLFIYFLKR